MKSIKIRWDTLDMEDKILTGVATFFEGDDPLHMKPVHTFKVSKSPGYFGIRKFKNGRYLPEFTKEEREVIEAIVRSYYKGLTGVSKSYHWLEI